MPRPAEHPTTARLRAFHKLGKDVLRAVGPLGKKRSGRYKKVGPILKKYARDENNPKRDESYLYCARKFAELYPAGKRLEWICGLGADKGKPLGPSHIMQLLSVAGRKERNQLANNCAGKSWSVARLRHQLARERGKQPGSGRTFSMPSDPKLARVELQFMADRWEKWIAASKKTKTTSGRSVYTRLPKKVQDALVKIQNQLKAMTTAKPASRSARKQWTSSK
jgi:hypothetical protein